MKTYILRAVFYVAIMVAGISSGWGNTDAYSSAKFITDERPLTELLGDFGERYQVFFSYEQELLAGIKVKFEFRKDEPLQAAIDRLLLATGLEHLTHDGRYIVITRADAKSKREGRKVMRKLNQIDRLQQRGNLYLHGKSEKGKIGPIISSVAALKQKDANEAAGHVEGRVLDAISAQPLSFATVYVLGSNSGETTDLDGFYRLGGLPAGEHILIASYLGYESDTININIEDGATITQNFSLNLKGFLQETVIVTAQRQGQNAAINQQVKSNSIVNVVSAERIRELPDENAAESVGRLPGVGVSRSGGEGQRVNIRGLSPKFSAVNLDGIRIPATGQGRSVFNIYTRAGGGSNPQVDDRSVDLSMISSEALAGIEVYKSLTPDQDGDAIGGSVNFVSARAPQGAKN